MIITKNLLKTLIEAFKSYNNVRKENLTIELAFLTSSDKKTLCHIVYKLNKEFYEEKIVKNDLSNFLYDYFKNSTFNDSVNFRLRFYAFPIFKKRLYKFFDPDIIYGVKNQIGVIIGDSFYNEISLFIDNNIPSSPKELLNPYWADAVRSNYNLNTQLRNLEIQLQRTFLNYLKLIYSLKREVKNISDIEILTSSSKYIQILDINVDFLTENKSFNKELLKSTFFGTNYSIDRKIYLLNVFFQQLVEWIIEYLKQNSEEFGITHITEWIGLTRTYILNNDSKEFNNFACKLLVALKQKKDITSEELNQIDNMAKKLNITFG